MSNLTKKCLRSVIGFLCLIAMAMPSATATSLWSDTGAAANLYQDHKAREVGDSLTIIINESSSAVRDGKASNSKSTSADFDVEFGIFGSLTRALGISSPSASASSKNGDDFQAKGSIANSNNVRARMTAQVIEVKPNGNLVILGTQSIKQNGEEQKITVSGVVRSDDVTPDNTVLSSFIGDAKIDIGGKGPIARKQRQGIITQLLNIFF